MEQQIAIAAIIALVIVAGCIEIGKGSEGKVEITYAILESFPPQLSVSVKNNSSETIYLQGCNTYYIEALKGLGFGESNTVWVRMNYGVKCVWEGNAQPVLSGETKNLERFEITDKDTIRVVVTYGIGCDTNKPLSEENCEEIHTIYSESFEWPGIGESGTEEEAIGRVKAQYPEVADIEKCEADIGCSEGIETERLIGRGGVLSWNITFWKGEGDCPAGCISKHYWEFNVSSNGTISKTREYGDPLQSQGFLQGYVFDTTCPGPCVSGEIYQSPRIFDFYFINSKGVKYPVSSDFNGYYSVFLYAENYSILEQNNSECSLVIGSEKKTTIAEGQNPDLNILVNNPCIV